MGELEVKDRIHPPQHSLAQGRGFFADLQDQVVVLLQPNETSCRAAFRRPPFHRQAAPGARTFPQIEIDERLVRDARLFRETFEVVDGETVQAEASEATSETLDLNPPPRERKP